MIKLIKVLIVEDDPMVAKFNKQYLSQINGFEVVEIAACFKDAIEILQNIEINLILLDIFMPDINGLKLLEHLRKTNKEVDVIIVSAASDMYTIKKAFQYGVVDYLIKPFEFERFNEALCLYREKQSFMKNNNAINQKELDQHILNKEQPIINQLPKGIDKNTLKKTWTSIQAMNSQSFSTEEIAKILGISRVSMRKYLNFLLEKEILSMNTEYGAVGRPIYKYRCFSLDNSFLDYF